MPRQRCVTLLGLYVSFLIGERERSCGEERERKRMAGLLTLVVGASELPPHGTGFEGIGLMRSAC